MSAKDPKTPLVQGKQISNPFSTGGGGARFETQVQASFAVLMLAGGFAPILPCRPIREIVLQAQWTSRKTDDLIVFTSNSDLTEERKLHVQIKHALSLTESNETFGEVVRAAWLDFNNAKLFARGRDALALVTGPLSASDIEDSRTILEWARHSASAEEFLTKVETAKFSSNGKREKLKAFRFHVDAAAGTSVPDEEFFQFLRHFHLLGYDLDVRSGVMHALLHTVIARHAPDSAESVWARVVQEIASANQNGGTVTPGYFPEDLRDLFAPPTSETIPAAIASTLPPSSTLSWNNPDFAPALVVANLLGACDEGSDADMALVRALSQDDPAKWRQVMREVLQVPDSPISLRGRTWTVKNREDLWRILGPRIFSEHLKLFRDAAMTALSEFDPQFDLEREQRFAAAVHGKVLQHSQALRRGVAETLGLLGNQPELLTNCPPGSAAAVATVVTRDVLRSADWTQWGSLNDLLPLLAEAAPAPFLDAIEEALVRTPCPFDRLFAEEGIGVVGRNYLTGLLWGLESLAWEEQYLVRVTLVLGALAARDPGGQWANRPANSLTMIFLPWLPQTKASEDKQLVAIRTLLNEHPQVGWKLLLSLMPRRMQMSHRTHKPRWRTTVSAEEKSRPSVEEYEKRVIAFAELAATAAGTDLERLQQLVAHIDQLPEPIAKVVLDQVGSSEVAGLPGEVRFAVWYSLTEIAKKHRRYAEAKWAKPNEWVSQIEAVAAKIAPREPENIHRRLFIKDRFSLYERNGDWAVQDQGIADRQRSAVQEILATQGIDGVLAFAHRVESPYYVGFALGMLNSVENLDQMLPDLMLKTEAEARQFAKGLIQGSYRRGQMAWVDALNTSSWSPDQIASLLIHLPFDTDAWQRVDQLLGEEAGKYWVQVPVNPYEPQGNIYVAVDALLRYGRPRAALGCLTRLVHDKVPLDKKRAVGVLLAAVSSQEPLNALDPYDAGVLITELQKDLGTPSDDLMTVEWAYLPILNEDNDAAPRTLDAKLASDPQFFCEIIRMVFRSKHESKETAKSDVSEERQAQAQNAYRMLQQWRTVPGTAVGGHVAGDALTRWIDDVKQSTQQSGHFVVATQMAGGVFLYGPPDPDGLWMHRAVAQALNRVDMDELRKGYSIAVYNSRGAHIVDPTGAPERQLAQDYARRADEIENAGFHRLAATLREISNNYKLEAEALIAEHKDDDPELSE